MPEKTLQDLSASATQTGTTITLNKADLGLTATTCTLDQIIAAIAIRAKTVLTQTFFDSEPLQNVYCSDGFSSFTNRNSTAYEVRQIIINLAKEDTGATLNPNNY